MISLTDIHEARTQIKNFVHETPVMSSKQLSQFCGYQVWLKSEHLQKTGSFKIRGATNKVIQAVRQGAEFVTTASSGNHGQAVAYIAQQFNIPAKIVVPVDASLCKIDAIKASQGEIIKHGTTSAERLPLAMKLAEGEKGVYIPPYDDPLIMAGQGTIGLEIMEQLSDIDVVVVPIGGGGLISGILTAIKQTKPSVRVIGVEPTLAKDTYLSLKNKKMTSIPGSSTIADGLRSSQPGDLPFAVMMKYLDDLVLVEEAEIRFAFSFVLERLKQLIEPSSATTIAAIMFKNLAPKRKKVAAVLSGGNVDLSRLSELIVNTNETDGM